MPSFGPPLCHSSPYPCSEPLHKTPNQTAITVHCAERHRGVSPSFACLKQHALSWAVLGSGCPRGLGGGDGSTAAPGSRRACKNRSGVGIAVRACRGGEEAVGSGDWDNWAIESVWTASVAWERVRLGIGRRGLTRWSSRWGLKSGVDVVSQQQASRNGSTQRNR